MRREQFLVLQDWYASYVKSYYSHDPGIQSGIILKEEHTQRVRENIRRIGQSLNLGEDDLNLSEAVGMFHDVGRYKQYTVYRTFNDRRSVNHAQLGRQELKEAGALTDLPAEDASIILRAVEYHNLFQLPVEIPDRHLLFARLIRDADKLDILKVFSTYYLQRDTASNKVLESGLPDTPGYSPALIENLLLGRQCSYNDMKNFNDRKLLMLSWIYDINFPYTLSEIVKHNLITIIIDSLPETEEIRKARIILLDYAGRYC